MRERPILFSAPMVRAILDGTKTQTRRVVKPKPPSDVLEIKSWHHPSAREHHFAFKEGFNGCEMHPLYGPITCPYGQPLDRLWVRETWAAHWMYNDVPPSAARSERCDLQRTDNRWFSADGNGGPSQHGLEPDGHRGRWRPSIHMPRWASRINLEITGVRVERLQDISEADAVAEGIERAEDFFGCPCWKCYGEDADVVAPDDPVGSYQSLWESINGAGSWDANPWVWVVEFKPVV